jgi:hypothetical protein
VSAAKIEALTDIKRGDTQVRKFLKDNGFRFRRVGTVPAKVLTEEKKRTEKLFGAGVRTTSGKKPKLENGLFILSMRCILCMALSWIVCGV